MSMTKLQETTIEYLDFITHISEELEQYLLKKEYKTKKVKILFDSTQKQHIKDLEKIVTLKLHFDILCRITQSRLTYTRQTHQTLCNISK